MGEAAWLLGRSTGTELFMSVELYSEDGLEMAIHWRLLRELGSVIHCSGLTGERALHQYNSLT